MIALLRRLLCTVNGHYTPRTPDTPLGWSERVCTTCGKTVMVFVR